MSFLVTKQRRNSKSMNKSYIRIFCVIAILSIFSNLSAKEKQKNYPSLLTEFEYTLDIEEKAKQGDSDALWMMGLHNMPLCNRMYLRIFVNLKDKNFDKTINQEEAIKMIEKSANKGNPIAMVLMGTYEAYHYDKSGKLKENKKAAIKWYTKAINCGYTDAYAVMAKKIYDEYDYDSQKKKVEYLNKGTALKSPLSAKELGKEYFDYILNKKPYDFKKAFECFSLVEECGFYEPQLTWCYLEGLGCPQNYKEAIKRKEAHSDISHPHEINKKIAKCFALGKGVKQDKDKAIYYFLRLPTRSQLELYNDTTLNFNEGLSFEDYITQIEQQQANYNYTPTIFEEDSVTELTNNIHLLKRGGVYFITNPKGDYLTHALDYVGIEGDSIIAKFNKFKTTIDNNGNMRNPIVLQMLSDWLQTNTVQLERWICSFDANGTYGAASILQNAKGVIIENKVNSFSITYNPEPGGKKPSKKERMIAESINKSFEKSMRQTQYEEALPFYEKAIELDPDFELAQMNVERMRKALGKGKCDSAPFSFGLSSLLQLANNLAQFSNQLSAFSSHDNSHSNTVGQSRNKNQKKATSKSTSAGYARNEMTARNTYQDYVSQLIDMKTFRDRYNDQQRKSIQRSMKQIREKYKFTKSEWEDWNGN